MVKRRPERKVIWSLSLLLARVELSRLMPARRRVIELAELRAALGPLVEQLPARHRDFAELVERWLAKVEEAGR